MKTPLVVGSLLPILLFLAGCHTNGLYFATGTQLGVEIGTPNPNEQAVTVGYKRAEGVVMPTRKQDGSLIPKAYPVVSIFDLKTGGLNPANLGTVQIKQVFATGRAAVEPNAETAVGNTMRELMDIPRVGVREDSDVVTRETLIDRLVSAEGAEQNRILQLTIRELGLPANADVDDAIDAIHESSSPAKIKAILDRI